MKKTPLIVIAGPTASGKTDLSVSLATKFGGEIVCGDSMQIYKELEISTAKVTQNEMKGVKHHLFGFLSVNDSFSVADYVQVANPTIKDIFARKKLPFLVGGTGLYIDSLIKGVDFSTSEDSEKARAKVEAELEEKGIDFLYSKLCEIDPISAEKIHINNQKRVLRALEIYYLTGKTKTQIDKDSLSKSSEFNVCYIGITYKNRQTLYDRINLRVDLMLKNGLIDEVKEFYASNPSNTAVQAIGCKELKPYLNGEKSLEECIQTLKQETRRYAKRQLTWFNNKTNINWVYCDEENAFEKASKLIQEFLDKE